eukprot:g11143.t1
MEGGPEPPVGKAGRDDAGDDAAQEDGPWFKKAKPAVAAPLMTVESDEPASENDVEDDGWTSEYEYEYHYDVEDPAQAPKHPAEVEAEAFTEALDGISAKVRFVSVERRDIFIYVQPWRLFKGLPPSTMAALGQASAKGLMVMVTTDQFYTMSNKPAQVRWTRLVEPTVVDAPDYPIDESVGDKSPLTWMLRERLGEELLRTWSRCDGRDAASPSSATSSAANPGCLRPRRGDVGEPDAGIEIRAQLKRCSATNLLVRLALIAIDRFRNAAEDCVVCGGTMDGDVSAVPTALSEEHHKFDEVAACRKPLCQFRCASLFTAEQRGQTLSDLLEALAGQKMQRQAGNVHTVDGKVEFQVVNDGDTVRFLIDLFRRGLWGTRPELGLPEHLLEPRLLSADTLVNVTNVRLLLDKLPSVEEMQQCIAKSAGNPSSEIKATDGLGGGFPSPDPPGAQTQAPRPNVADGAVAVANAVVSASDPGAGAAVAVPGVARNPGDDSTAADGPEADSVGGAGTAREPRREDSPALKTTFPLVYPLLQWLLSSEHGNLKPLRGVAFRGFSCDRQFIVAGSGEREARFQELKRKAATEGGSSGSFFAFHGSSSGNWHGILRLGLKNMSDSKYMSHGFSIGKGIYLADDLSFSLRYAGWRGSRSTLGSANFRAMAARARGRAAAVAGDNAGNTGTAPSPAVAAHADTIGAGAAAAPETTGGAPFPAVAANADATGAVTAAARGNAGSASSPAIEGNADAAGAAAAAAAAARGVTGSDPSRALVANADPTGAAAAAAPAISARALSTAAAGNADPARIAAAAWGNTSNAPCRSFSAKADGTGAAATAAHGNTRNALSPAVEEHADASGAGATAPRRNTGHVPSRPFVANAGATGAAAAATSANSGHAPSPAAAEHADAAGATATAAPNAGNAPPPVFAAYAAVTGAVATAAPANTGMAPSLALAASAGATGAAAAAAPPALTSAARIVSAAASRGGAFGSVDPEDRPPAIVAICEVIDRPAYKELGYGGLFVVPEEEHLAVRFLLVNPTLSGVPQRVSAKGLDLTKRSTRNSWRRLLGQ